MKLLYSSASPYSSKVRMAAHHAGIAIESEKVVTSDDPALLIDNNPLGKIPTLVIGNGQSVYDSVAINRHLDRLSGGKLYPADAEAGLRADVLEALGDGIADCLLAIQYEHRMRPPEKVYQGWIDKQWTKAGRALDALNANPPAFGETLTAGDFALAATLGYLALRFPGPWEEGRANLLNWIAEFEKRFPAWTELKPLAS
ncbi:glutathione S-transferase family protein [Rhizobiaceae bacterium BDR2-2]|uniref:Glutathione S-transferase family protein n=1 Tax=Ectorhizobium quercum TaxID=2965071 RepID=A0AAE3SWB8_9HYPH|nr:glutathione S-transferase family protein [Ectorhizobium quercum]MCX8999007.1 glutathione S-transferase family protein [Ectorhizobium quercum]